MKHRNTALIWWSVTWLCLGSVMAQAEETLYLEEIGHSTLSGNRQQLSFRLSDVPPIPNFFTTQTPMPRLVLDLMHTKSRLASRIQRINSGDLLSVKTATGGDRTRIVVEFNHMLQPDMRVEGKVLYLVLQAETEATVDSSAPAVDVAAPAVDVAAPAVDLSPADLMAASEAQAIEQVMHRRINSIDFRRGETGEGRVVIDLSRPGIAIDIDERDGRIELYMQQVELPDELRRRLDVLDFATPVKYIDAEKRGDDVRILITPNNSDFEQLAYQSDRSLVVELRPFTKGELEQREKEKFGYVGERLSLSLQDVDVRSVLQLLADFTGINIVVSDTVQGELTLRLKNVPWDQALDIILLSKGLTQRKNGNVILIAPAEEVVAREQKELEAQRQAEELEPLQTEFIQVNYARVDDIVSTLKTGEESLLSKRGSVTANARTNILLVTETIQKIRELRQVISELDIPVRQVLIESRIVVANDDFRKHLGARAGLTSIGDSALQNGSGQGVFVTGNLRGNEQILNSEPLTSNRWNVDLPVTTRHGSIGFSLAKFPLGTLLELELSAMQAEGQGEVVSSPRVITADKNKAVIEQGVEIPYQEATSGGATSVSFRKAVLSLEVTPQITPDEQIIMSLKVNKDTIGQIFQGIPSINTREVDTQVLVENGETIVLGGVFEEEKIDQVDKIPFLGDLPLVGRLFRQTRQENTKKELLIFVTPKIIKKTVQLDY